MYNKFNHGLHLKNNYQSCKEKNSKEQLDQVDIFSLKALTVNNNTTLIIIKLPIKT